MDNKAGLLLEGGAMRSVFSAGVLDCFLEKDIRIPNVLAVSAGAYAGMNYVSGQKGRVVDAVIKPLKEYKYLGLGTFLRKGTFFDMEFLFHEVPKKVPFDFQSFLGYPGRFITSMLNCESGENVYYDKFQDEEEFFTVCQAANSLPLIAKMTQFDGAHMLDGGMADAIPVDKALSEGWEKLVVVLTRDISYRKKPRKGPYMQAIRLIYRKYPAFLKLISDRSVRYNESLDKLAHLEKEGRAFVLRPTTITVGNNESSVKKLMDYYNHGYQTAAARLGELAEFLGIRR